MSSIIKNIRGFSTVELLITLFIAAVMIAAGYQLFNVVVKDGGDTRAESTVNSVAYDYLRRYTESAENPCNNAIPGLPSSQAITIATILNPVLTVTITCPQPDTPTLSKVEVTITYGEDESQKIVKSTTYVDKSTGASTAPNVTDGLIGWWKLNGNSNSASGSYTGTATNTTNATGQNGVNANAFSFNGSSSFVTVPLTTMPKPTDAFSITLWFNTSGASNVSTVSTSEAGGWNIYVSDPTCVNGVLANVYINGVYAQPCTGASSVTNNVWNFAALVYDSTLSTSQVKVYLNSSTPTASVTAAGAMTWPTGATPICIGAEPNATACTSKFFNGSIDDVRFYGKALSTTEIGQLIAGNAK